MDPCIYSYSADGKHRCIKGSENKYDFSVLLTNNVSSELVVERQMNGIVLEKRIGLREIMRLPGFTERNGDARITIVDSTLYNDVDKPSLQVYVEYDEKSRPVPVIFSRNVSLADFYNRTAFFDIKKYNGATIYISDI